MSFLDCFVVKRSSQRQELKLLKSPLQPPSLIPKQRQTWGGLWAASRSLAVSRAAASSSSPILLLASDGQQAHHCLEELRFFAGHQQQPILFFPDWETLPYDHFSPHEDLISERLSTLYQLSQGQAGIVVTTVSTLMQRLPPSRYLHAYTFLLSVGDRLESQSFCERLVAGGYCRTEQVMTHGEFAMRGSIIDVFPMGARAPFRLDLFDETVDSLRYFDVDSQCTIKKIQSISILPAHEFPLTPEGIAQFREQWRAHFPGNPLASPIYQAVSKGQAPQGIEYYLPLFFEQLETFFDYLPVDTVVVLPKDAVQIAEHCWQSVKSRYEQQSCDPMRPLLAPQWLMTPVDELFGRIKPLTQIQWADDERGVQFASSKVMKWSISHHDKQPLRPVQEFMAQYPGRLLFAVESAGRQETLSELLLAIDIEPQPCARWSDFLEGDAKIGIVIAPIHQGCLLTEPEIALITESELFGETVKQSRLKQRRGQDANTLIRHLTELNIGVPVVHFDYGVGRYQGLQHLTVGEIETEYLVLEYADQAKIYVPITSLHLISRYAGGHPEHAPLQKLGTTQWERIKEKATQRIRDVAAELLDVYSRRAATPGFAFPTPDTDFQKFREAFPFEETPDQRKAIDEVIQDMTRAQSMDRLICGDVGFGKTEVAMQAAFLAVQGGKQVALLVPTTLLAAQHFTNFKNRFADWPMRVGVLSRLQSPASQKETLAAAAQGNIDIIIGTHKLLSAGVLFQDLGLLIVDEEHRFGVRHKEKIKSLKAHIDILMLTATPIPRTLNMALSGTRDLSIIATPPDRRLAIKTFVHESNDQLIREAVVREALRGGQVYFLYNAISTIQGMAERLHDLIPEARIGTAHGQLTERELEQVMSDFYRQKFNILLCTTIIESGIDVPNANTIIVYRADQFGLAQLHQLRGRVGRSHHQAYAYLLTPPEQSLTADAKKRLTALTQLEHLGAGFMLATHDLEIRGAGELLGEEQSGQMQAIGFSLYVDLLKEAVDALKAGNDPVLQGPLAAGPEIDIRQSALIPEHYVADVNTRLTLYKRLSGCSDLAAVHQLKAELIDRFGPLPQATQTLFKLAALKPKMVTLGIQKVEVGDIYGRLQFSDRPNVDPEKIVTLIQSDPSTYQLQGADTIRWRLPAPARGATDQTDDQTATHHDTVALSAANRKIASLTRMMDRLLG